MLKDSNINESSLAVNLLNIFLNEHIKEITKTDEPLLTTTTQTTTYKQTQVNRNEPTKQHEA